MQAKAAVIPDYAVTPETVVAPMGWLAEKSYHWDRRRNTNSKIPGAAKTTKKDGRDRTWPLLINTSPRKSRHNDPNEWGLK